ncbi:MAG: adenosylcobinamide-phosphate synthase CbiB [Candidatus Methanoplasma sp.]|jgi:adenosylcobinamide-phosphate synthase|nr:adenosylcobinamide-phosphate synthase CbiB [Candidatus Methanoplasma sp.]
MELWFDAILIVLLAIVIDRIGEPPNALHPLRWIGNTVGWLDRRIKNRASKWNRVWGMLSYLGVFLLFWTIATLICTVLRYYLADYTFQYDNIQTSLGEILWIVASAVIFKFSFAVYSFRHHCRPIQKDLEEGRTEDAAAKVQMIVSRKTKGMDAEHIASSCCETISENLVDSICSPVFYFGFLGVPGAVMFRCANLMDAMWGYLNDKYGHLGFFPAKFDDVLGYVTSRISPVFVAFTAWLMRYNYKGVIAAAMEEHRKTPSPNSGWPMTAVAAALGISMEKKDVYVMGKGPMPSIEDISRCYRLVEWTSIIFILVITLPLFVFIGVHVQIYMENLLHDLIEMII